MIAKYGTGNYIINPINYIKGNLLLKNRQKCSPGSLRLKIYIIYNSPEIIFTKNSPEACYIYVYVITVPLYYFK